MIKIIAMLLSVILMMTGCAQDAGSAQQSAARESQDSGTGRISSDRTEVPRVVPTEAQTEPETAQGEGETEKNSGDILIIYTGNVRCSADEGIGYAGVASLKKKLERSNEYVALVDCGDATWGGSMGEGSDGLYIIDIMNHMGYDLAVPGDHDFDYGMEALQKNMDQANYPYIACNLEYTGKTADPLTGICPYVIKEYGDVNVAFIGAVTPEVLTGDHKEVFEEDGECVYDMCAGSEGRLYERIQESIDAARDEGADYVILVSHLGAQDESYGADAVAAHTEGIDAILDAPSHAAAAERIVKNKSGENVILAQMGEKLSDVGILMITSGGNVLTSTLCEYPDRDADVQSLIDDLMASSDEAQAESSSGGK